MLGEQYDDPDGFSYVDAANRRYVVIERPFFNTIMIKIKYIYKVIDLQGEEKMMDRHMLFHSEKKILPHDKRKEKNLRYNHPEKNLDVCSLVQFEPHVPVKPFLAS